MKLREDVYYNQDKTQVVTKTDPAAATLLFKKGTVITDKKAEQLGLVNGMVVQDRGVRRAAALSYGN